VFVDRISIMSSWVPEETTTHQDHVIAHVLGATVLGYFIFDEVLHVLLDIGFVWGIFLDGKMSLMPHPVAIAELEWDATAVSEIKTDIDSLLGDNSQDGKLLRMTSAAAIVPDHRLEIVEVNFFAHDDRRLLLIECVSSKLAIETSLTDRGISVYEPE
jgi:hypothetical protein